MFVSFRAVLFSRTRNRKQFAYYSWQLLLSTNISCFLLAVISSSSHSICALSLNTNIMSKNNNKNKNIVIIGGGIQGTSVAYHLAERIKSEEQHKNKNNDETSITVLEAISPASAASGKGGGFMARSWGDGTATQSLHELSFDLYESIANQLHCTSYRKLPVLSVSPGNGSSSSGSNIKIDQQTREIIPNWLDGTDIGKMNVLGHGDDTAQITPSEFVEKMLQAHVDKIQVIIGRCIGFELEEKIDDDGSKNKNKKVTGVRYVDSDNEKMTLSADVVIVSAGPWSCMAEDWLAEHDINIDLPMEGVKSTSIVWKPPRKSADSKKPTNVVDGTALFCGEDHRYGTHLEVYPRPNGEVYICGIGGSDYIKTNELKNGAYLNGCNANSDRVQAAVDAFTKLSTTYEKNGILDKTQACMRPCPPDGLPYMGPIVGCEGLYINAGHNCWGIAWAPACGVAMTELIVDGQCTSINIRPFNPTRFTTKRSLLGQRGRKKQGMDVGEQW